jgi:NAD(P)-dependent dehydrogenase (short-subunit alcohol dehydrogenase family)
MSYNPFTLEGKTILITGASSGIGRATAIECSKLGAKCVITGRNEERLNETLSKMEGEGHEIFVADMASEDDINALVASLPKLDGLVNNAGYQEFAPVSFIKKEKLDSILSINTTAPIILTQKVLKAKKLSKEASVVFTSSLAGAGLGTPGNAMYAASKGAISSYIHVAALELASKKIRVNAVCPGMVETKIMADSAVSSDDLQKDMQTYPLGRYGKPEEIAWSIVYLLSDASAWITGTNMIIDGGLLVK